MLPVGLVFVADDGQFVSYEDAGERVFKIPALDAGTTATFTFQAKTPASLVASTTYTNGVRVISGAPLDTNPLNDTSYVTTTVTPDSGGGDNEGGG